jgi:hypothetical protein
MIRGCLVFVLILILAPLGLCLSALGSGGEIGFGWLIFFACIGLCCWAFGVFDSQSLKGGHTTKDSDSANHSDS